MLVKEMSPEIVAEKSYSKCISTLEMKEVVLKTTHQIRQV